MERVIRIITMTMEVLVGKCPSNEYYFEKFKKSNLGEVFSET